MSRVPVAKLIDSIRAVVDESAVLSGADMAGRSAGIWSGDSVEAAAIVRPVSAAEVAEVLKICNAARQPVVTHGGLTGLSGGAVASVSDIVISTERMNKVEVIDPVNRTLLAESGVTLEQAQSAASLHDLSLAMDLGARGSCTLGGNAATNAGGNRVIRYGMTREQVLGLEVVLADGTVLTSLSPMLKNNAGYDLKHLFIGSEGTLGIITRLMFRLRPLAHAQQTALVACPGFHEVVQLFTSLDASLDGSLSAFELMWGEFFELVSEGRRPFVTKAPYYVLVEALGAEHAGAADRFVASLDFASRQGWIVDAALCKSGQERAALWGMRDDVERTLQFGPALVFDVSLPFTEMENYVHHVHKQLAIEWRDAYRLWAFGHAGDGNLHLVVAAGDGGEMDNQVINQCVYQPLELLGGSISGEHGVGLDKKEWLGICRTEDEINAMRTIKGALDPHCILNPGRIFDMPQTQG